MYSRICDRERCRKPFTTQYADKKYCSRYCVSVAWQERNRAKLKAAEKTKPCEVCDALTQPHKRVCSTACGSKKGTAVLRGEWKQPQSGPLMGCDHCRGYGRHSDWCPLAVSA